MTAEITHVGRPAGAVQPGDVVAACDDEEHEVTAVEYITNALGGDEVVLHAVTDEGDEIAMVVAPDHEVLVRLPTPARVR